MPNAIEALVALGFTEIEARAYCELLQRGPSTSYQLASAIQRAPSNIYSTLEGLRRKGAILGDESEPRSFRALPVTTLLASLESGFKRHKQAALESLRTVGSKFRDDRLYNLKGVEQVFERGRAMLGDAREIVLFDLFPEPFRSLQTLLKKRAAKGTTVAGICYGELPSVPGLRIYAHPWREIARAWPGQQLTLIVDAKESLLALLARDGKSVRHAFWTDSVYLSCLLHSGLACEIQIASETYEAPELIRKFGLLAKAPPGLRSLAGAAPGRQRKR